jgi:hypothetical protein
MNAHRILAASLKMATERLEKRELFYIATFSIAKIIRIPLMTYEYGALLE